MNDPYPEQYVDPYAQPYAQSYAEPYADPYAQPYAGSFSTAYQDPYPEQDSPDTLKFAVLPQPSPVRTPRTPQPQPASAPAQPKPADGQQSEPARRGAVPTAVLFLLPALVTLVMGGYGLGSRQVGQEESATWWAASLSWGGLGRLLDHTDVVLAPFYVLMHAWVSLAGTSPTALRLPSLLAMAAAAGLLAVLGRRMFDAPTGLVAGLVFAVLPVTSQYAQDARPFGPATLAALVAAVMLYRALDHEGADRWGGYALALLLTGLFHLVTATVLLPFMVLVMVTVRSRLGAWASVTAVCVVPMFAFVMLSRGETGQASATAVGWSSLEHFPQQLLGSAHGVLAMAAPALLGVVLAGRRAWPLVTWIAVPPLLLFGLRNASDLFDPSYFVFTVPAWALLAAAGLCGLVRVLPGRASGLAVRQLILGVVVTAALAAVVLPDLKAVRAPLVTGQPDFRAAAQWLDAHDQAGDGITYSGDRGIPQLTMGYALRGDSTAPKNVFLQQTPERSGTYTGTPCLAPTVCAKGYKRIWLLSTTQPTSLYAGMSTPLANLLKLTYKAASTQVFPGGVTLVLLQQAPVKA
ncbi:mannosyltransferase [Streptomyces sp. 846.5]|nr:glycosyltransferase family 39 protein [Streptomyces sp. 846.5]TDU06136.1 mannosyltransferase [Streptomyces sp. 846.5]